MRRIPQNKPPGKRRDGGNVGLPMKAQQGGPKKDFFADIAATTLATARAKLTEPQPPRLPPVRLPARRSDPHAAFRPLPRMDTADQLQAELERERRRCAPFLRESAPPAPSIRRCIHLPEFDWRLETAQDRRDFSRVARGRGAWQKVRIPHYAGPTGRAVAYYRTVIDVAEPPPADFAWHLRFRGADYVTHAFLNGMHLGSHEGFFEPFSFPCGAALRRGRNTLVVKLENDAVPIAKGAGWGDTVGGDKLYAATGPGWDDPQLGWHHCPPGMGLYQAVWLEACPAVHLTDLFVRPVPDEARAEAWIEVCNQAPEAQPIAMQLSLFGRNFKKTLFRERPFASGARVDPGISRFRLSFDLPDARRWDFATPWLYLMRVALANGDVMDRSFGMRTFTMDEQGPVRGRLRLNGREIRLRGANTMGFEQQAVMNGDLDRLRDDILLARVCRMNFLRLTQRPVQSEIYDMCDRLGMGTQTDLPLFGVLPRRQFCEAVRQAGEMEKLTRGHPCALVASFINEPFPDGNPSKEAIRHCSREELASFFVAARQAVRLHNPDRVIKPVDGDYDPPSPGLPDNHCYNAWYNGHGLDIGKMHKGYWQRVKPGWLYGCGEFGAEGLDPVDLMRRRYPSQWLPATDREEESDWNPDRIVRAQTGNFHYMFFDTQRTVSDWVRASQRHQAWATRFATEAFRRDNRMNSFAIHLFIDAWPAGWMKAIMDAERVPKPAFFAYRDALAPLKADIRTDRYAFRAGETMRFEFRVCNDLAEAPTGAQLRYQLERNGRIVFAQKAPARIEACRSVFQGFLDLPAPAVARRQGVVLRLGLFAASGQALHDTAVALQIFPAPPARGRRNAVAVAGAGGAAARLVRQLGWRTAETEPVHVFDDPAVYGQQRREFDRKLREGATLVFLDLPVGEHRLAGSRVAVENCGMGPRHFVSRKCGHPMTADLEPEDFRLWYDPKRRRIAPLLQRVFVAPDWTPILTSGNGLWRSEWGPVLAAAEKRVGRGTLRVCQVALEGRVRDNPVADLFARRLLTRPDDGLSS